MSKFRIGTRVNIISGHMKGSSGIIKESCDVSNGTEYHIILDGESEERIYYEHNLEFENILDMEIDDKEEDVTENTLLDNDINDNSILLLEMAGRIPGEIFVDKKGKRRLIIAVGSNETRGVAHFHVFRNKVDWRNWKNGACLMFKKNKYFDHKDNSETLTKDELEVVMKCLKSKPAPDLIGENNWQFLISLWNSNNYDWKIDINTLMQEYDYDTITRYKEDEITESSISENILDMEIDDYESYYEMAQVKWGLMSIKLAIYGKEGSYPHFHFYKECAPEKGIPEEKKASGGCLCIESANYFIHGTYTEKMNPKEIEGLIEFLKSPHKSLKKITNWEYIVDEWNQNNPDQKQLPVDLAIPDYRSDMNSIQEDKRKNK